MGQSGIKQATVAIFGLETVTTSENVNPTNVSGNINVVLDVQPNDETVSAIALTLNGETIQCRGTSADADLAGAGGQLEVNCLLRTATVDGECMGMQMSPKYANGEYTLGAFVTTDEGAERSATATQPIMLKNSGFVEIVHAAGEKSLVVSGETFYGGPSDDDNTNMIHACPVAYDETVVGELQLTAKQIETGGDGTALAGAVSFRTSGSTGASRIRTRKDDEAPFTWTLLSRYNSWVEDVAGSDDVTNTEHWFINDGAILDPDGRDVGARFRTDNEPAMSATAFWFDFRAPTISDDSEIVIAAHGAGSDDWTPTTARYYRDSGGNSSRRFRITGMADMGVGHAYGETSMIAVGDISAGRNADTNPDTDFTPIEGYENVTFINQLAEEDPNVDGVADGGGVDSYVAELQSLADRLGNGRWLGGGRIRTATNFGVDRTAPVISRERPAESLVLGTSNELFFEIEDPEIETGEAGSDVSPTVYAWAGDSRYWVESRHYWSSRPSTATGSVTVDVDPTGNARFAREESHTVYVRALDVVGNATSTSFTFVRDQTEPKLSLSAVPSDFSSTVNAASVNVTVAGTLSDATEMQRVFLSIHAGNTCTADSDPLKSSQVSGPIRRLDNETNKIEFSEVFTVKKGDDAGPTSYCFFLEAEDIARDADDRATPNVYSQMVSTFSVAWPAGTPPPPAGPTFEFMNLDETDIDGALEVTEGAGTGSGVEYAVKLANVATAPTATAPLTVTLTPSAGVSTFRGGTAATTLSFDGTQDTLVVEVLTAHDLDIMSDMGSVAHSATGYEAASVAVQSNDDDFAISADMASISENDAAAEVTVTTIH
ncbi:MAG: hypothetical protein F4Y74_09505 [Gemmatimonadales bacterium]|nr:hypothetical protein [Gemmatimonadales bacterium]